MQVTCVKLQVFTLQTPESGLLPKIGSFFLKKAHFLPYNRLIFPLLLAGLIIPPKCGTGRFRIMKKNESHRYNDNNITTIPIHSCITTRNDLKICADHKRINNVSVLSIPRLSSLKLNAGFFRSVRQEDLYFYM